MAAKKHLPKISSPRTTEVQLAKLALASCRESETEEGKRMEGQRRMEKPREKEKKRKMQRGNSVRNKVRESKGE